MSPVLQSLSSARLRWVRRHDDHEAVGTGFPDGLQNRYPRRVPQIVVEQGRTHLLRAKPLHGLLAIRGFYDLKALFVKEFTE